ncbi:hypothetical protein FPOAC2_07231 [Fusarium poae]|uniref:hypothetical protein n=1 Tax=Fusarium poae TaxID=36050 RepID=UPI001CE8E899|nr:hypothetical protein FPOAC1_007079 [Fusarium poae]KAG8673760.1 hypothetical protein FPOAC1_007079 [Fusarium poae]
MSGHIANHSSYLSDEFLISCGTVTLDIKANKVLLVRVRKVTDAGPIYETILPRSPKLRREPCKAAALRATFEQTGIQVQPLPAGHFTLAVDPVSRRQSQEGLLTEPIGIIQTIYEDGIEIIFFYVAWADSTIPHVQMVWPEGVDFQPSWQDLDDANSFLSRLYERRMLEEAMRAVVRALSLVTNALTPA